MSSFLDILSNEIADRVISDTVYIHNFIIRLAIRRILQTTLREARASDKAFTEDIRTQDPFLNRPIKLMNNITRSLLLHTRGIP